MAAPVTVSVVELPLQIVSAPLPFTVGKGVTFTVIVAAPLHPLLIPCTVYVVLTKGFAVTLLPEVGLRPVTGNQLYVEAPPAVRVVEEPLQITPDTALPVTVGRAVTTMDTVAVLLHPEAVPVRV